LTDTETSRQAPSDLPMPRRHLAFGTLLATGAQIGPLVASAAISLVIARVYGPSSTGVISLAMNLFDVTLMIFTLGLSSGITYLISRHEWPLRQARREMYLAAWALGCAGAICGMAFYLLTRHSILKGVTPAMAIVLLSSLPFALAWAFCAAAALGRHAYEAYATFEIGNAVVLLLCGVVLAIVFGVLGAVAAFAAAQVVTVVVAAVWLRRQCEREPDTELDASRSRPALRRATRFGLQAWSANLLQLLNYRLDIFILSALASRSAVGVYSIAVSVTALGWVLPNAVQTVLFPRVATLDAATSADQITSQDSDAAACKAVRHSVLIMGPTALMLVVLVLLVPLIYGQGFTRSTGLGLLLIPGVVGLGIAKVLSAVFSGRGFPRYALYTTAITVPITLALYAVLIPPLDATGAALASSLSYLVTMALSVVYFRKATAIPLRAALVPSREDVAEYVDAARSAARRLGTRRVRTPVSQ
jgi:O-antigen/teichoic acid export membrane protein